MCQGGGEPPSADRPSTAVPVTGVARAPESRCGRKRDDQEQGQSPPLAKEWFGERAGPQLSEMPRGLPPSSRRGVGSP